MCGECIRDHIKEVIDIVKWDLLHKKCATLILAPWKTCGAAVSLNPDLHKIRRPRKCILHYPGSTYGESFKFTVILRIFSLILGNLEAGKTVTSRDIYYQDIALFKTQKLVVRHIEQLTRYFCVPRDSFNVVAAPNGLIAGDLLVTLENDNAVEIKRSNGPSLIPVVSILHVSARKRPEYILVVEKEAVFSHLQAELTEGIIITGKGFPDHATRNLVTKLAETFPDVPLFGLVDSDVHGILILRCYEHGPIRAVEYQKRLKGFKWLGVSLIEYQDGLVKSKLSDKRTAMATLRHDWIHGSEYNLWKAELQRGLYMGVKGEMNLLDINQSSRLCGYVRAKIQQEKTSNRTCNIKYI